MPGFPFKIEWTDRSAFPFADRAEWEYVARGGNKTQLTQYSGSANVDEVGWYYPNSQNTTHAVKTKKPNELGFYDMSGNVWEFCMDYKNEYPKEKFRILSDLKLIRTVCVVAVPGIVNHLITFV